MVLLPDDWFDAHWRQYILPSDWQNQFVTLWTVDISPSDGENELIVYEKLWLMWACTEHLYTYIARRVDAIMKDEKIYIVNIDIAPKTVINEFLVQEWNQAGIALLSKDDIRKVLSDTAEELWRGICSIIDISTKWEHNSWKITRT